MAAPRPDWRLACLIDAKHLMIADIGCGTGASTLVLAKELDAIITAVDYLPDSLAKLEQHAKDKAVADRITPLAASMADMPFEETTLNAIWSEGAIYSIGFANGIRTWRRFLRPGGIRAISELTWLTTERPAELDDHWNREYPEVATASTKLTLLEEHSYSPIGYFPLPVKCWLDNYYRPIQRRFEAFLARHDTSKATLAIVDAEQVEIALYEQFSAFVSYDTTWPGSFQTDYPLPP